MSQFITTFSPEGKSVFSSRVPRSQNAFPLPIGTLTLLYTTHSRLNDISTEGDIDRYVEDRVNGLPPHTPCPPNGTSACLISIMPNASTPERRTISLGVYVIAEGELVLSLDSGEQRRMRAGDAVVMRAPLYKFTNVTPNDGWAKIIVFAQHVEPITVEGVAIPKQAS